MWTTCSRRKAVCLVLAIGAIAASHPATSLAGGSGGGPGPTATVQR